MAKKKIVTKVKTEPFHITLTVSGTTYKSKGATAAEALKNLEHPVKIFSKGLFKMEQGARKIEQVMMPVRLKRLFWTENFQAIHANILERAMR